MSINAVTVASANARHARVQHVTATMAVIGALCMGLVACEDMTGTPMTDHTVLSLDSARQLAPLANVGVLWGTQMSTGEFVAPVPRTSRSTTRTHSSSTSTASDNIPESILDHCKTYSPRVYADKDRDGFPAVVTITWNCSRPLALTGTGRYTDKDDNDPSSGFKVQIYDLSLSLIHGGELITFGFGGTLDVGSLHDGLPSIVSLEDFTVSVVSSYYRIELEQDLSMTLRRAGGGRSLRFSGDFAISWDFDCASAREGHRDLCQQAVQEVGSRLGRVALNISSTDIELNTAGCITSGTIGLRDGAGNEVHMIYNGCGRTPTLTYNGSLLL